MDNRKFKQLADAYGADLTRWPDDMQAEAQAVAATPWARAILSDAASVDALFAPLQTPLAPSRIGRNIGAVTAAIHKPAGAPTWWRRFALSGTGLVTAGIMGVALALSTTSPPSAPDQGAGDLLALALSYSDSPLLSTGDRYEP
jgi:hypothetical protein